MFGVLLVLNVDVVEKVVCFGLGIDVQIVFCFVFVCKNYFYLDLLKGYQILQFELFIVGLGQVDIMLEDGSIKCIGVIWVYLEEDVGKFLYEDFQGMIGIDLN